MSTGSIPHEDIYREKGESLDRHFIGLKDLSGENYATGTGITGIFSTTSNGASVEVPLNLASYTEANGLTLQMLSAAQIKAMEVGPRDYVLRLFAAGGVSNNLRRGRLIITEGPSETSA